MTDPEFLWKHAHLKQKQIIEKVLESPEFQDFKGNLSQPVFSCILRTFGVSFTQMRDKKVGKF